MSKTFTLGVLVVLISLLGVMTLVLQRTTNPPKPSPEQQAQMQKASQEQQKKQMEEMKARAEEASKAAKKRAQAAKAAGNKPDGAKPAPKAAEPYGVMDISEDWDRRRTEGQAGVAKLHKEDAARAPKQGATPAIPASAMGPGIPNAPASPGAAASSGLHSGHDEHDGHNH